MSTWRGRRSFSERTLQEAKTEIGGDAFQAHQYQAWAPPLARPAAAWWVVAPTPWAWEQTQAVLHGALKQAMKNQLVVRNVSEATVLPSQKKPEIHPLTLDQLQQFLAAIRRERLFPAIFLELGTGLRLGKLLALRWQDVDLRDGLLHVRRSLARVKNFDATGSGKKTRLIFQEPKTKPSRRTIPIPEDILEELKGHKARQAQEKLLFGQAYQDHDLVFCRHGGTPLEPKDFSMRFSQMLMRLGLPKIRFHDARHTFATVMLELGEHPKTVQTLLGHTKITTTLDIYSHVSLELEKRAAARFKAALRERVHSSQGTGD